MSQRHAKHSHVARALRRLAKTRAEQDYSEFMHAQAALYDDMDGDYGPRDTTCPYCSGTGGDPWNDGVTPCEHCDGEGYEWWM